VVTTLDAGIKKVWLPARGGSTWKRVTYATRVTFTPLHPLPRITSHTTQIWSTKPLLVSSYGGGQTWPATVRGNAQLILQHQAGAEAVSLRAKAVDGNGNTVEQAIINAYKLR
jgi:hypothetical protein